MFSAASAAFVEKQREYSLFYRGIELCGSGTAIFASIKSSDVKEEDEGKGGVELADDLGRRVVAWLDKIHGGLALVVKVVRQELFCFQSTTLERKGGNCQQCT
ncbi:hypothetical protein RHSIM_Rhsim05G0136800 [Rhododendron simsii]|uniref:Uncharacterized protein n=1 Tax=Rhododendron simsii TaxID=118357 RepID=A0A834GWX8_RHOSS|nr:hypothetical protein RHSIM_Rhsim05G0136800 [Rhododendron simsii]